MKYLTFYEITLNSVSQEFRWNLLLHRYYFRDKNLYFFNCRSQRFTRGPYGVSARILGSKAQTPKCIEREKSSEVVTSLTLNVELSFTLSLKQEKWSTLRIPKIRVTFLSYRFLSIHGGTKRSQRRVRDTGLSQGEWTLHLRES